MAQRRKPGRSARVAAGKTPILPPPGVSEPVSFRRPSPVHLLHARYEIIDFEPMFRIMMASTFLRKTGRDGTEADEWMEGALVRNPGPDAGQKDFVANFFLGEDLALEKAWMDLYTISEARMAEARAMLDELLGSSVRFLWVGPYEGGWPSGKWESTESKGEQVP